MALGSNTGRHRGTHRHRIEQPTKFKPVPKKSNIEPRGKRVFDFLCRVDFWFNIRNMTAKQFIEANIDMTQPPNWDVIANLMDQYAAHIASDYINDIGGLNSEIRSQQRSHAAERESLRDEIRKLESLVLCMTTI